MKTNHPAIGYHRGAGGEWRKKERERGGGGGREGEGGRGKEKKKGGGMQASGCLLWGLPAPQGKLRAAIAGVRGAPPAGGALLCSLSAVLGAFSGMAHGTPGGAFGTPGWDVKKPTSAAKLHHSSPGVCFSFPDYCPVIVLPCHERHSNWMCKSPRGSARHCAT